MSALALITKMNQTNKTLWRQKLAQKKEEKILVKNDGWMVLWISSCYFDEKDQSILSLHFIFTS